MTPEAQRIAMARLDGWESRDGHWWSHPERSEQYRSSLLIDYPSCLNSVARVVGKLNTAQRIRYRIYLAEIVGHFESPIDATAAQRCEAILKATGKWEDGR